MRFHTTTAFAVIALACTAGEVAAQGIPRSPILDRSIPEIRTEIDQRYQAAVAQTLAPAILAKNDPRYTWASEAKVACGIALGYLKTKTVDEESINKCDEFARRMTIIPTPPPPPPPRPAPPPPPPRPAPPPAPACTIQLPVLIYFDFDVDVPSPEAKDVLGKVVQSMNACGWSGLSLTGHTDRSGSDKYNQGLSERRARNVAALVNAAGVAATAVSVDAKGESAPAVPTPDGVREPLNRRVEVNATSRR
jgi:OmpA-OmpF porin, OOP family